MATPMITRRGGYPVRYAKPVALASLTRSITPLTQDRRAPFVPSRALPDLEYLGEDKCAEREAAERRAPPTAPPAGISRGGRGNSRNRDGRRGENGQRFPHGVTSMSVESTMI